MGLDIYLRRRGDEAHTDVASRAYPDHLCNRRYLRSSYNNAGFNRAVPDMVAADHSLYWIFEPVLTDSDQYESVGPAAVELRISHVQLLEDVRRRALQVADEIRQADPLRVETVTSMTGEAEWMWSEPPTEGQVLAWYREEAAARNSNRPEGWGEGYSNAKGSIFGFTKGLEVLAVSIGRHPLSGVLPSATQTCPVIVYREDEQTRQSYVATAEIVAEFAEEAIDLIKADGSCYLDWSA